MIFIEFSRYLLTIHDRDLVLVEFSLHESNTLSHTLAFGEFSCYPAIILYLSAGRITIKIMFGALFCPPPGKLLLQVLNLPGLKPHCC